MKESFKKVREDINLIKRAFLERKFAKKKV